MLLAASSRIDPNANDSTRLQISAFEAINDMVRGRARRCMAAQRGCGCGCVCARHACVCVEAAGA